MVLSNRDIENAIRNKEIIIKPLEKEQIGPASIDLTLSKEWYFLKKEHVGARVDLNKLSFKTAYKKINANMAVLAPGDMCLGKTVEKITLAPDIMGRLEGRSRYARMGVIIHLTSALVQPGSSNRQVLEIVNLSPFTMILHEGMRISQVVFDRLDSKTTKPYAKFGKIAKRQ